MILMILLVWRLNKMKITLVTTSPVRSIVIDTVETWKELNNFISIWLKNGGIKHYRKESIFSIEQEVN